MNIHHHYIYTTFLLFQLLDLMDIIANENINKIKASKNEDYEDEFEDYKNDSASSNINGAIDMYSSDILNMDSFQNNESILLKFFIQIEEKNTNNLEKTIKNIRNKYYNYDRITLSINDLINLMKLNILAQNDLLYIWEFLLNSKTERNFFNEFTNEEKSQTVNTVLEFFSYFNFDLMNLSNLDNNKLYLYLILKRFIDVLISQIVLVFETYLVILFCKLINKIKVSIVIYTLLMISTIIVVFKYYFRKKYLSSSVMFIQFIWISNSLIQMILSLVNYKEAFSLFDKGITKSSSQFTLKLVLNGFFTIFAFYIVVFYIRFWPNYFIFLFLLSTIKEYIDSYFMLKPLYNLQPFSDFSSFITGALLLIINFIIQIAYDSYMYEFYSFMFLFNIAGFYYLIGFSNFYYVTRFRGGILYIENEKKKTNQVLTSISIENQGQSTDFWDVLNTKRTLIVRTNNLDESSKQQKDYLIFISMIFILFLGFFINTYFYIFISIYLNSVVNNYTVISYSIKTSRIVSSSICLLFLFVLLNLPEVDSRFLNETLTFYDKRFFEALKTFFAVVFYLFLSISVYLSYDFINYFCLRNYDGNKYLMDEIYNNIKNFNGQTIDEIYKNRILKLFQYDYSKDAILKQVNKTFELLKLPNKGLEIMFIEHLIERDESNWNLIPLVIDLFLIYISFVVLKLIQPSNTITEYVVYLHMIFLAIKLFIGRLEYRRSILQKFVLMIFNLFFIPRLMNSIEEENYYRTIFMFPIYYQLYNCLLIENFYILKYIFVFFYCLNTFQHIGILSLIFVYLVPVNHLLEKYLISNLSIKSKILIKFIIFMFCYYLLSNYIIFTSILGYIWELQQKSGFNFIIDGILGHFFNTSKIRCFNKIKINSSYQNFISLLSSQTLYTSASNGYSLEEALIIMLSLGIKDLVGINI